MRTLAAITACLTAAPAVAQASFTCLAVASCVASTACAPEDDPVAYDVTLSDTSVSFRDALGATNFDLIRLPERPDVTLEAFRGGIGPDQGVVTLTIFKELNFVLNIAVVIRNDAGAEVISNAVSLIGKCAEGTS